MKKIINYLFGKRQNREFLERGRLLHIDENTTMVIDSGLVIFQNKYGIIQFPFSDELIQASLLNAPEPPPEQIFSEEVIQQLADDYDSLRKEQVLEFFEDYDDQHLNRFIGIYEEKENYELCTSLKNIVKSREI